MGSSSLPRWLPLLGVLLAACALILPSCATDGNFSVLGYSTKPNYDVNIRTVRVPIFKNKTFYTVTPVVGMEMDLTRTVIREIEAKTPFKVIQDCQTADTELRGTVVDIRKRILNYTPFNTVRDAELSLTVNLIWRDLRTGKLLSRPPRRPGEELDLQPRQPLLVGPDSMLPRGIKPPPVAPIAQESLAGQVIEDEDLPLDPFTQKPLAPVSVRVVSYFRPEIGQSFTTALQENYNRLATQIVSLMEQGW